MGHLLRTCPQGKKDAPCFEGSPLNGRRPAGCGPSHEPFLLPTVRRGSLIVYVVPPSEEPCDVRRCCVEAAACLSAPPKAGGGGQSALGGKPGQSGHGIHHGKASPEAAKIGQVPSQAATTADAGRRNQSVLGGTTAASASAGVVGGAAGPEAGAGRPPRETPLLQPLPNPGPAEVPAAGTPKAAPGAPTAAPKAAAGTSKAVADPHPGAVPAADALNAAKKAAKVAAQAAVCHELSERKAASAPGPSFLVPDHSLPACGIHVQASL